MTWPIVSLGDIFDIARGGSPRPIDDYLTDSPDGVNWISIKDASNSSKYITSTAKKILPSGVSRSRQVKPGDFLLTNSMSFGRPYILKTSGCIHDGWLVLSSDTETVDQDYFYHLLGSEFVYRKFEALAAGAVVKNLNIELVKSVKVALPPLTDQRRIAGLLDKSDAVRAKRREATTKVDQLLHSVFEEMFGDPLSNPKKWAVASIGQVADVQGGLQVSAKRSSGALLPYMRVANVHRGYLDLSEIKQMVASEVEARRTTLQVGDLLVVEGHGNPEEIGRCAIWDGSIAGCIHQNHLIRVRPRGSLVTPQYLEAFLNSPGGRRDLTNSSRTTSGLNTISVGKVQSTSVLVPPLELQRRWGQFVASASRLRARLVLAERSIDSLRSALQDRAFAGAP